jgi:TRAP-type C4-dicarboxylate transport system substrate-binding protein
MKRGLILLIALVVGSFLIISSIISSISYGAEQKATVLRLAGPWPPLDPVTLQLQAFADKFNKRAGGKYVVEVHPGESIVKLGESVDALRTGSVEMAGWPIGMFASVDRRFAAAEVPFLVNTVEGDAAMQVALMPLYSQFMEKKFNSKAIFSFTCLALDVCSTKPVKTAADWKGLLTQSVSPQSAKFIEAMGGAPVAMPFPEGYQALQKGIVNATMQSSSMMIMFKLNEVSKYVTRGYLIPASLIIAVNMDAFKKMPKDIQNILVDVGKQQQKETNDFFIGVAQKNTKTLTDMGLEVYALPKAERDQWAKKLQPYCDSLFKAMGPEFSAKVKKIAAEANAKYPY